MFSKDLNDLEKAQELINNHQKLVQSINEKLNSQEKLSFSRKASLETSLENSFEIIKKNQLIVTKLESEDKVFLDEKKQAQLESREKLYYKIQKIRIKRLKNFTDQQKAEAIAFLEELDSLKDESIKIKDDNILVIASKSLDINLQKVWDLDAQYTDIDNIFNKTIENIVDSKNQFLLNYNKQAVNIIFKFYILNQNLKESYKIIKKLQFKNPKTPLGYHKWWLTDFWDNKLAYISLCKWKSIVSNIYTTPHQKELWNNLFYEWIQLKYILYKSNQSEQYHKIFDTFVKKYGLLKEETNPIIINTLKKTMINIARNENFDIVDLEKETAYINYRKTKKGKK